MAGEPFHNTIITGPVVADLLQKLAAGHHGIIKVVVDIRLMRMAAGGEWHTDCLKLLAESGSSRDDCWGAKYDIETGNIVYKSQINQNRPGNIIDEIQDGNIRNTVAEMVNRHLVSGVAEQG